MSTPEITLTNQTSVLEGNQWKAISIAETLFLLSLISMFLPVKVYPVIFLVSSFFFYRETPQIKFPNWSIALAVFSTYAVISYLINYPGEPLALTNIIKLVINFSFLFFAINWLGSRENEALINKLDTVLLVVLALSLVQLLIYHQAYDFSLILGSDSSGEASALYRDTLFYWGLDDKNMFGARIALMGFSFIAIPIVLKNKLSIWRIVFVFLVAFLSLSRTPIVALLIGVFLLIWFSVDKKWKIGLVILIAISLPFVLQNVLRVDSLTSSNDGMGIRLVYWKAFFEHFETISPLGNGFLSAPDFLETYADFYRGESHIHNTFLSTYLQMGIVGFISFVAFLIWFIQECWRKTDNPRLWVALFLPILAIMMILYSGYDNDVIMYFCLIFLISSLKEINFKTIKIGL
ncbi:O-antigen ligase family protein [Algoriphagus halophytocola]|uniref:O-antigen ligase family protein n=1 Tax=Algoriphagus halophytocola TaxID=2991499 RepID=A0ABY6ME05_9BACT|nr:MULTISPECIES: O-antigen ligase family protein [unclassified Algoriphagus]UZD22010.1 O-antigen ligase family protein [Algoriphagus sp. TR-M5]WBL43261.1 O-antigen ligase family protein [Algoriphagus sp. TR-M9]